MKACSTFNSWIRGQTFEDFGKVVNATLMEVQGLKSSSKLPKAIVREVTMNPSPGRKPLSEKALAPFLRSDVILFPMNVAIGGEEENHWILFVLENPTASGIY